MDDGEKPVKTPSAHNEETRGVEVGGREFRFERKGEDGSPRVAESVVA